MQLSIYCCYFPDLITALASGFVTNVTTERCHLAGTLLWP